MNRWDELTRRTLDEIERCEPVYRPTTFWGPGVRSILDDVRSRPLAEFKSWPSARTWFYPTYGNGMTPREINAAFETARRSRPELQRTWVRAALGGLLQARRDYDVARLAWDQARWPFDLEGIGESQFGAPPQPFELATGSKAVFTRPYLNYLLCLAALSRHVDAPPRRFLELGGGFGVLGEIVMSRDPDATYTDLDMPPLLTVASSYLDMLFADRVATYETLPEAGPLWVDGSACLPNWRIRDLRGPFDVFVNSFSFQEMEPEVVERYATDVAALEPTWVVSLNSRAGKPVRDATRPIGVLSPVTSRMIVELFEARGYECIATYADPLLRHQGELAILHRSVARSDGGDVGERVEVRDRGDAPRDVVDLRRGVDAPSPEERRDARRAARRATRGSPRTKARGLRGRVIRGWRAVRRRLR